MDPTNLPDKIFDLVATKSYQELTDEEKNLVTEFIDEAEYNDYHRIINDFKDLDTALDNSKRLKADWRKKPLVQRLLTRRIPVYQAAAAMILLFFTMAVINQYEKSDSTSVNDRSQAILPDTLDNDTLMAFADTLKDSITKAGGINNLKEFKKVEDITSTYIKEQGKSIAEEGYPKELALSF